MNKIFSSTLSISLCSYLSATNIDSNFINSLSNNGSMRWHAIGGDLEITDMSIFDNVYLVWAYKDGEWYVYSNVKSAKDKINSSGYPLITSLARYQGFWVLKDLPAQGNHIISSTGSGLSSTFLESLSVGWHHIATSSEISDLSVYDTIAYLWYYDELGNWKLYKKNYLEEVSKIPANSAIWIKVQSSLVLNTVNIVTNGREVTFGFDIFYSTDNALTYIVESDEVLYSSTDANGSILLDYGEYDLKFTVKNSYGKQESRILHLSLEVDSSLISPPQKPVDTSDVIFNGLVYKPVISPITNKVWLDRNLGATQVCTSTNDTLCYGDYYQWGRLSDGHEKYNSDTLDMTSDTVKFSSSNLSGILGLISSYQSFSVSGTFSGETFSSTPLTFSECTNISGESDIFGTKLNFSGCSDIQGSTFTNSNEVSFECTTLSGAFYQSSGNAYFSNCMDSKKASQVISINNSGDKFVKSSSDWATDDINGSLRNERWNISNGSSVCPNGYRVPTDSELLMETLDAIIDGYEDENIGKIKVTGQDTAYKNFLKIPSSGIRYSSNGNLSGQGSYGYVWTNTISDATRSVSKYIYFGSNFANDYGNSFAAGLPIRCIQNE